MPPRKPPTPGHNNNVAIGKVIHGLLQVQADLVGISSRVTKLFHEVRPMPVPQETQAAIDGIKTAIAEESAEINTKVQGVIDAVNAGASQTEVVAQLQDIQTAVRAMSDALPTGPSTTADPNAPTG